MPSYVFIGCKQIYLCAQKFQYFVVHTYVLLVFVCGCSVFSFVGKVVRYFASFVIMYFSIRVHFFSALLSLFLILKLACILFLAPYYVFVVFWIDFLLLYFRRCLLSGCFFQ